MRLVQRSKIILAWLLVPIGLVAALLVHPLATGAEELTRWQTIIFANKTAMFFMVLIMIALAGGICRQRAHSLPAKAAIMVITAAVFLVVGWRMSLMSPFDIALQ